MTRNLTRITSDGKRPKRDPMDHREFWILAVLIPVTIVTFTVIMPWLAGLWVR